MKPGIYPKVLQDPIWKKLNNKKLTFDFPVMYANTRFFDDINDVLGVYTPSLKILNQIDYKIKKFKKAMEETFGSSVYMHKAKFKATSKEKSGQPVRLEQVTNLKNEMAFEITYSPGLVSNLKIKKIGIDKYEDPLEYEPSLKVDLGNMVLYFDGNDIFVDDLRKEEQWLLTLS